ncbi:hypothetical protein HYW53_02335 [Candidatus Giovannonibacteria bacterium]|nr:hypothetical protein [Candidatus Giovannonibacteria bacterium]
MSSPAKIEESSPALPENGKALGPVRKKKFAVRFDAEVAFEVFSTLEDWWRERRGYLAKIVPPHHYYLPRGIERNSTELCRWLFFMAIPMRGGINSDDAFRFMKAFYESAPEFFDPHVVQKKNPDEIMYAVRAVAGAIHNGGSKGRKKAGTFSYKMEEHVAAWIVNARVLVERWGGDVRKVFESVADFEEAFARVDYERNEFGFIGMRRKIFSLLTLWMQDFHMIHKFPMPLIVDFHTIRMLLQHRILQTEYKILGPNNTKNPLRVRPESMWNYTALRVTEKLVDQIITWSQKFCEKRNLVPYDVAHGLWYNSRLLCASYLGNRSKEKKLDDNRRTVTEFLIDAEPLKTRAGWPKDYRDPCRHCPVETTCKVAIPSGPYFDWGVMVKAGKHVLFPGRQRRFAGIKWREMSGSFRSTKTRHFRSATNGNGNGKEENAKAHEALQLPFYED